MSLHWTAARHRPLHTIAREPPRVLQVALGPDIAKIGDHGPAILLGRPVEEEEGVLRPFGENVAGRIRQAEPGRRLEGKPQGRMNELEPANHTLVWIVAIDKPVYRPQIGILADDRLGHRLHRGPFLGQLDAVQGARMGL